MCDCVYTVVIVLSACFIVPYNRYWQCLLVLLLIFGMLIITNHYQVREREISSVYIYTLKFYLNTQHDSLIICSVGWS